MVAYASKKLRPREKNYSVIERECLGVVYAVKKFQSYLYGHKCKIESARIMQWALYIHTEVQVPSGGDKRTRQSWSRLPESVGLIIGHISMCVFQWLLCMDVM